MINTPDNGFVPLTTTAPPDTRRSETQLTVVHQAENAQPFRALSKSAAAPNHAASCEPRVTLQREGDRVSSIQVHCSCGQVIELACVYETPPDKGGE